ncbi:NAD(P)H-binding protein, partial [bacterium]|nr:NAD(P)H-binding protein [bacterium]
MANKVAIFGATGYVGLILVNRLIDLNWNMKLFARNTRRLLYLQEHTNIETCNTELSYENISKLAYDLQGYDCVYYLIHSMSDAVSSFETLDRNLAEIVALSAKMAGVKQIIYLGGLGYEEPGHPLSVHLSSRHEIAAILASGSAALTDIRAGIIIGAGSASFEIIKSLGARLPFIPKLSYVNGFCQPIDIDSVIAYLIAVHLNEHYFNKIIEIGSNEILSYPQMVQLYAKTILQRELKLRNLPVLEKIISKKILAHI